MSVKTAERAVCDWVKACERNKRFEEGTATAEDWAELCAWLSTRGLAKLFPPKDAP